MLIATLKYGLKTYINLVRQMRMCNPERVCVSVSGHSLTYERVNPRAVRA